MSVKRRPPPAVQESVVELEFDGVRLVLYELDCMLWLSKGQVSDLLGKDLSAHARYFKRWHTTWTNRIVVLPDGTTDRVFTLDGAAAAAGPLQAPRGDAFKAWVEQLRSSGNAPPGAFLHTEPIPGPDDGLRAMARRIQAAYTPR